MPNILLVCYKIERNKGSEDGSGYHIARRLCERYNNITLISRENNIKLLKGDPIFAHVNLIGLDVPWPFCLVKREGRGIIPYYYMWQWCVGRLVRVLQRKQRFDVIHQLNFHTDWAPHFLANSGGKVVWGPMSHHKYVPTEFLPIRRFRAQLHETIKIIAKQVFWRLDPFLRGAIRRTNVILYADEDLAPPFRPCREKVVFQSYAGSIDAFKLLPRTKHEFKVLSVGRLVPLKGFSLAVEAFAAFLKRLGPHDTPCTLTLIGSGELELELKTQCEALDVADKVTFVPWVDQVALLSHYAEATVFLYPSFEAQGLVVAEAMAASVPVVCLAETGPAFLVGPSGLTVPRVERESTVAAIGAALSVVFSEFEHDGETGAYTRRAALTREEYDRRLDWDVVATNLANIYEG